MTGLREILSLLSPGEQLAVSVPTHEYARRIWDPLLGALPQPSKLLVIAHRSRDRTPSSRGSYRSVELAGHQSTTSALGTVKRALSRIPKSAFVVIDGTDPERHGETFARLLRLVGKSPFRVVWFVSRDSLSNDQIASLKDGVHYFLDVTALGSVLMAQLLTARGVYEPDFFLPRVLTITESDLLLAKAPMPVLVPPLTPGQTAGGSVVPTTDLAEQKYRRVFENSREGMMLLEDAAGYREANDRLCDLFGYPQDEFRILKLTALVGPDRKRPLLRALAQIRRKGRGVFDTRAVRKSGRTVDIRVYASRIADTTYLAVVHDITDEKRSEATLQRREEEARVMAETDPIPRAVFVGRKLAHRNPAFDKAFFWLSTQRVQELTLQQLFGRKNNDLVKRLSALGDAPDRQELRKARAAIQAEGGNEAWFEISARPIIYGGRAAVQCGFVEITDDVRALRHVTSSEEKLRSLVEHDDEALSIDDGETFVYVNRKFLDMGGFAHFEEVTGKSITVLRTRKHRIPKAQEGARGEVFRETVRKQDGSAVDVETERIATTIEGKQFFLTYRRDVSEQKKAETEIAQRINALEYVRKISTSLHRTLDLPDLVRTALGASMQAAECESGAVLSVAPDSSSVRVVLAENVADTIVAALGQMSVTEGLTGLAAKTEEPVLLTLPDYPPHLPYRSLFESEKIQSVVVLPVVHSGRHLGVIFLSSREPRIWDEERRLLLSLLAGELGVAFGNAVRFGDVAGRETMYRAAIDTSRDILYRCAPGGAFTFIGSGVQALVDYTPEDFLRSSGLWRDLVHPDDRTLFSQRISHQARNVDEFTLEYRVLPRGKAAYKWIRDSISYDRDASGEVLSMTGVLSDTSESKRVQDELVKSEQLKSDILNSIQEGIVVFDTGLRYIEWNRSMESVTGIPRNALLGRRVGDGEPVLTSQEVVPQLQRALRGEAVNSEEMPFALSDTETERLFWSQYAPLRDGTGTIKGVVGIITDVTKRRQLEQEVRESEETLRNVIDTMGDGLMISDLQGRVWEVNREFTRLTGIPRKEAQGMDFPYPWVLEEDMAKFVAWIAALREKNYLRDFDMTWKARDGRLVAISINTTLLRNALGEPVAMLNIARDISERRHLTEELERKVQENVELYAQVQAQVHRLTSLYELGKSLTGTLDARTLFDIVQTEVAKAIPFDTFTYYQLAPDHRSLIPVYTAKDGQRWYEKHGDRSRCLPLVGGTALADLVDEGNPYVGVSSQGDPAQEALLAVPMKSKENVVAVLCLTSKQPGAFSESHLRLFESIATLTEIALEKATLYEDTVHKSKEIEERNKELDDFTYVVSHDLKEPLITIEGYSKIMLKDYLSVVDQDGKEYLQTVVQSSNHMKSLIDDLLTLSRLGHVKEGAEVVPTGAVVAEILQDIQFTLHERNAEVVVSETLPEVRYSRTQLGVVFRNLITNAVKFNDKPRPRVDIGVREEGDQYVFSVKDNGIGIEERYFDRVFMIFQRLQRKEEYQGTGAGLTIVKKIVENHHGRIWVSSVLGEGTTFSFTIPK